MPMPASAAVRQSAGHAAPIARPEAELRDQGFCVVRGALPAGQIGDLAAELRPRFEATPHCEGLFSGQRTKRFHGLLKRCEGAVALVTHPLILQIAEHMLLPFCDVIQLNLTQAIEIHPGEARQVPHRDQDMWQGEKGTTEYLINVMWPLSPFTPDNGGTLLWPGSHLRQEDKSLPLGEAVSPELAAGDALIFLGSTLHGAGSNLTCRPRQGIIVSYCLGWLKPYENMWLTYPPDVARRFPRELADLVGYRLNRPNLGNYDGNCPSILLDGSPGDHLPTRDCFLPAQHDALERHALHQRACDSYDEISSAKQPAPDHRRAALNS
jgi:ectoine hydroxylase-related dioxygenase (phytanoyl-CoA dioxygenase family)